MVSVAGRVDITNQIKGRQGVTAHNHATVVAPHQRWILLTEIECRLKNLFYTLIFCATHLSHILPQEEGRRAKGRGICRILAFVRAPFFSPFQQSPSCATSLPQTLNAWLRSPLNACHYSRCHPLLLGLEFEIHGISQNLITSPVSPASKEMDKTLVIMQSI